MTVDITINTPDEVLAAVREMEALNPRSLNARMGIEVIEASAERLVATMPVEGNTQPYGLLHGGASVVLAETLGSVGAAIHAGEGKIVVGVDINATHHRVARTGLVTGVAVAGGILATRAPERRRWQWPLLALIFVVLVGACVAKYLTVPVFYR